MMVNEVTKAIFIISFGKLQSRRVCTSRRAIKLETKLQLKEALGNGSGFYGAVVAKEAAAQMLCLNENATSAPFTVTN